MAEQDPQQPPTGEPTQAQQEEMMRQMEEEVRNVRVQDVLTQSVVSLLNLSARRIGKEDERDLEQARIGIEAVRALVDLLDAEPQAEVRKALSQVQMLFAQHAGEPAGPGSEGGGPAAGGTPDSGPEAGEGGVRKPPPGLWTPGSSS